MTMKFYTTSDKFVMRGLVTMNIVASGTVHYVYHDDALPFYWLEAACIELDYSTKIIINNPPLMVCDDSLNWLLHNISERSYYKRKEEVVASEPKYLGCFKSLAEAVNYFREECHQ